MSFAGLAYLSIFLAEFVFALPLPHLSRATAPISAPIVEQPDPEMPSSSNSRTVAVSPPSRKEREAPLPQFPIMVAILIVGIPIMIAMYIASTRFSDYRHHAFDIFAGSALGIASAWLGWRWYGAWTCAVHADGRVYNLIHKAKSNDDNEKYDRPAMVEEGAMGTPGRAL